MFDDNLKTLKQAYEKTLETQFREPWQWRIDIIDCPLEIDIYVKDLTRGIAEIKTEEFTCGPLIYTLPEGLGVNTISMTIRDNVSEEVSKWFEEKTFKTFNEDGTCNLPADYLVQFNYYSVSQEKVVREAEEQTDWKATLEYESKITKEYEVIITQIGDVTETREGGDNYLSFPVTMIEFCNFGYKYL